MKKYTDSWKIHEDDKPSATQFSLRPTIRISAQIHALTEMFPDKSKTEILNELLTIGLSRVIGEITNEDELSGQLGRDLNFEDYGEEGQNFIGLYQNEREKLLTKANKEEQKKGGEKAKK